MNRVAGVVTQVDGRFAWVELAVAQGCGRCHEPGGCGGVDIARPFGGGRKHLKVENLIDLRPGERVAVCVEEGLPLRAALWMYGVPVLGVILGAVLGRMLASPGGEDVLAGLGALAGLIAAVGLGRMQRQMLGSGSSALKLERQSADAGEACRR